MRRKGGAAKALSWPTPRAGTSHTHLPWLRMGEAAVGVLSSLMAMMRGERVPCRCALSNPHPRVLQLATQRSAREAHGPVSHGGDPAPAPARDRANGARLREGRLRPIKKAGADPAPAPRYEP